MLLTAFKSLPTFVFSSAVDSLALSHSRSILCSSCIIQTRWRKTPKRKPRWMPMAPTKLFKIHIPKHPPPEERTQITRLYNYYFTEWKAITNYFREQEEIALREASAFSEAAIKEEGEFQRLLEENRKENERVAQYREQRHQREQEEKMEELLMKQAEAEKNLKTLKKELDEIVKKEKEKSSSFITLEKLEEAIEHALDHPVNYNYAVDLYGNKYWETPESALNIDEQEEERAQNL